MFDVGDHVRASGPETLEGLEPGVTYRVVGSGSGDSGDEVVLLAVTNTDARRAYTGVVMTCPRPAVADTVVPVENPDAGLALRHRLRTLVAGLYWTVGRFV